MSIQDKTLRTILAEHKEWADSNGKEGVRADFTGFDLRYADMSNANLCKANLCKANLRYADLYKADLYKANLYNANLRYADLYNANLRNADMSEANLCKANLRYADLCNADMSNANLSFAKMTDKNILIEEAFLAGYEALRFTPFYGYEPPEVSAEAKRLAKEFADGHLKHPSQLELDI